MRLLQPRSPKQIDGKLSQVVQKVHVDNVINQINHYPANSLVCFVNTYPLDSDLSGGELYPAFQQLSPDQ